MTRRLFFLCLCFVLLSLAVSRSSSAVAWAPLVTAAQESAPPASALPIPIDPDALIQQWQQMRPHSAQGDLLSLGLQSAAGRTIYVDVNAAPDGDGSPDQPFRTIQAGIDAAVEDDVVLVRSGLYAEAIVMKDRVAVVGEADPEDVVIQASTNPSVVCADKALLQDITVNPLSIISSGVIDCASVSPIINRIVVNYTGPGELAFGEVAIRIQYTDSAIVANTLVDGYRHSIIASGGLTLVGNLLFGHTVWEGWDTNQRISFDANIFANNNFFNTPQANRITLTDRANDPTTDTHFLINNWVINTVIQPRGAIVLANNTILGGSDSGGIYLAFPSTESRVDVVNNIIGYTEVGLWDYYEGSVRRVENNLFWQNGENVQGLADPMGKNGNIQADPQFVDLKLGDFHLALGSPAIDAAQNLAYVPTDFDFESRMCDGDGNGSVLYDIGADEFSNATCHVPLNTPTITPTATPTLTATPTSTLTPTPAEGCRQLLGDPGFDSTTFEQDGVWHLRIQGSANIFQKYWPSNSIDGQYVLEIAHSLATTESSAFVEQDLRLPPGEITFDLHWMREVQQGALEPLTATLVDPTSGEILQTLWTSPPEQTQPGIWHFVQLSFVWPAQQDVRLRIGGFSPMGNPDTDTYSSQFLLDDVRLTHCAPIGQPTVTVTPIPTATPTPTPTPGTPTAECQQLIAAPGFWPTSDEWKTTGGAYVGPSPLFDWASEPLIGYVPIRSTQSAPSALYQTVHLPPQSQIRVEFYTKLKPEVLNDTGPLQTGLVQIRSEDGSTVLTTLRASSTAHPWTQFSYGLSEYAGQSVQVWFGGVAETDKTATFFQIDDVYLTACPPGAAKVYLPQLRKDPPPPTPTPTPTPTVTPTATPVAMTPISPPSSLQGGPLGRAQQTAHIWYLDPTGQIHPDDAAEPFPLDPALSVRSIATGQDGTLAATDQGIYLRDETFRWRRISDMPTRLVGSMFASIWRTTDDQPEQISVSHDGGVTWQNDSTGLEGVLVSPVYAWTTARQVLTLRDGRYVLWEQSDEQVSWTELAIVPGAALAYAPGGITGGLSYRSLATGLETRVSSSDGNIYRLRRDGSSPTWEILHNFGDGVFPLILDLNRVSVIDLDSGDMQLYEWQGGLDQGEWIPAYYPSPNLPMGHFALPDGQPVKRIYGQGGWVGMALTQDGALYAGDMGGPDDGSVWAWRVVTETPERTDFVMAQAVDEIGSLYSGAHLQWDGSTCTADPSGFYRSADKGLTWTEVVSDTARQPVAAVDQAQLVLAATCAGPSLSQDGGDSWRSPADLGWPLSVGAQHLALYDQDGITLYAAGIGGDGAPFLYRAAYDAQTGALGAWTQITPTGLGQPQALFISNGEGTIVPQIYLADEQTVWLSTDNGSTWQSRGDNLSGAKVWAFYPYANDVRREAGMLVATDQGLFFGPAAGQTGPWIPTGYAYTRNPVDFQWIVPGSVYLNGQDGVFLLPFDFFAYIDPATLPTPTPTSSVSPTATPQPRRR